MTERFCMNKGLYSFEDTITGKTYSEYNLDEIVMLLNEFHEEKEKWKNNCLKTVSENSILWNEISILREQGALPSDAFKNYLNNLKNKNKKLQGDLND